MEGTYSDNTNAEECYRCERGSTSKTGATECSGCDLGMYGIENGVCANCPAGQYQDGKGMTECNGCPLDTYLSEEGKSSKADCLECSIKHASHTTTSGERGVTNPLVGCVCARARSDAGDAEAQRGYYTTSDANVLKEMKKKILMERNICESCFTLFGDEYLLMNKLYLSLQDRNHALKI